MTTLQRIQLRMSEARQRINAIQSKDGDRTDEERAELRELAKKLDDGEVELRAAIAADETETTITTEDSEDREIREIRSRTSVVDFMRAAAQRVAPAGAAAEFAQAHKVPLLGTDGINVPHALFDSLRPDPAETRAVTPGPAVHGAPQPTIPFLYERTIAARLGFTMPSVAAGVVQVPSISTAPPADTLAKDGAAPSTAAAYSLATRSPKRISGAIEFRVEDSAVHPALESDLTMALSGALGNEFDEELVNGDNTSGSLNGLFQQATDVAADGTTDTFALGLAAFSALVDGHYAYGMEDLTGVVGSKTFAAYMALYHGGSGDMTLFEKLRSLMGALFVSDRMPAVSGGAQKGLVVKRAGGDMPRTYMWNSIELIRDPYSGAGAGKVTCTAVQLVSDPFIPHGTNQVLEVNRDLS